jgi:acetyl esterase/lipase
MPNFMKKNRGKNRCAKLVLIVLFLGINTSVFSQNQTITIWTKVPGAIQSVDYKEEVSYDEQAVVKGISKVSQPTLTLFLADSKIANGTSVVICPGGGYDHLAINKEGYKIAKWFNDLGISAFILKYRLPSDLIMAEKSIGPLQDAQEAIRIIRRNAVKWHLDSNKIGIMGFSAGGHLAATLSTQFNENVYIPIDNISARPDFSILIYPVISMQNGIAHQGSKRNLLGTKPSSDWIEKYSNEKRVDSHTPKTFLVHATDDKSVSVENSINYYLALKQNHILAEMHIYENGGHGFGLGVQETNINWPNACEKWLASNGYITKTE